jgi:O-antigen/teichoic acid export membrane protein
MKPRHRIRVFLAATGRVLQSKFARSGTWMLQGQGIQLGAQFTYFVVIAHALGPKGYGTFVACTAVVLALAPFGPWGGGQVMVKYASRNREELPVYFGNAIFVTLTSGLLITGLLLLLRSLVLPASVTPFMLVAVAIADLICTQITAVCSLAFMALDLPRKSANVLITSSVLRVLASLILLATSTSPIAWAQLYLAAAVIAATFQVMQVSSVTARPKIELGRISRSLSEGFHFATSFSAQTIYDNIDKGMLGRFSSVEAAAVYAVAYRFVDASMLPIRALASATYPEFFRQGEQGVQATFRFAKKILRHSMIYGLLVTICLFIAAGVVPMIMGPKFADSAIALRWLCPLPFIKSIHAFLTDTLTGGNHQADRSAVQLGAAAFNVLINLWLIRAFSWRGASWSSIATDGSLMIALYVVIKMHLRREREDGQNASFESAAVMDSSAG